MRNKILASTNPAEIQGLIAESDLIYEDIKKEADPLYNAFTIILGLCIMNCTFLL